MTSYRYLGYGTTDANGVAHLKKNASGQDVNGYVGTGAGEVDVIASLDNPISQGSIVSGTCSILDTLFYDDATPITSENWSFSHGTNILEVTSDENATTVKRLTSSGNVGIAPKNKTFTDFEATFDIKYTTVGYIYFNTTQVCFFAPNSYGTQTVICPADTWQTIKFHNEDGVLTAYKLVDGEWSKQFDYEHGLSNHNFRFSAFEGATYVGRTTTFKNFRIWSI